MPKKVFVPPDELLRAARTRKSPLQVWMIENHDMFAATVAAAVRPNWSEIALYLGGRGLRDADGKPPTAEGTRITWWRVRKMMQARATAATRRRGLSAQPAQSFAAAQAVPSRRTVEPFAPVHPAADRARPRLALRPARVADPSVPPEHDGSQLPRPVTRIKED